MIFDRDIQWMPIECKISNVGAMNVTDRRQDNNSEPRPGRHNVATECRPFCDPPRTRENIMFTSELTIAICNAGNTPANHGLQSRGRLNEVNADRKLGRRYSHLHVVSEYESQ